MTTRGDRRTFRNEDLILKVTTNIDPKVWDESKYEAFLDELCSRREYQKESIRTTLRFLLGGKYADLRALAKENFEQNPELEQRYGSWAGMEKHLQLPDQLAASIDQATGTGKSYVLYGLAAILLAEGAVDRVLVLCPSNTIEAGLLAKFKELAGKSDLRDLLPETARVRAPKIINASETIVDGSICVENYHAILENVKSSIRDSLKGKGERVAVLNDEAHHVANESGTAAKRWKEFLLDPEYGFRIVVGVSGTCYVEDEYFADVVSRYSLRQAIEERFVKRVEYVAEMPETDSPDEKWQLIYNRHQDWKRKLKKRRIRPLTIIVTKAIADFKTPANLAIADATPERKFIRLLTERENALEFDAWLKNTPIGFYSLEYAWKKGNKPKRGEFSPDFFLKQGDRVFVTEIKGEEEIADPSPENVKKYEYAAEHFKRLNQWLDKEKIPTRYQFNMLTPKDYNKYFNELRKRKLAGFLSAIDVAMRKAAGDKE